MVVVVNLAAVTPLVPCQTSVTKLLANASVIRELEVAHAAIVCKDTLVSPQGDVSVRCYFAHMCV